MENKILWDYKIFSNWDIFSKKYWKIKILLQRKNTGWYLKVNLCHNWVMKTFLSHRIIAKLFIPNPENKKEVNHINGIKTDNRVENLEWCTSSENIIHSFNKLNKKVNFQLNHPMKWKFWKYHKCAKKINQYSLEWEFIKEWDSIIDTSNELKIYKQNISACCRWKLKTAGGFIWKFK